MVVTLVITVTNNNEQRTTNYSKQTQSNPILSAIALAKAGRVTNHISPIAPSFLFSDFFSLLFSLFPFVFSGYAPIRIYDLGGLFLPKILQKDLTERLYSLEYAVFSSKREPVYEKFYGEKRVS
jgi:hypothetical protein